MAKWRVRVIDGGEASDGSNEDVVEATHYELGNLGVALVGADQQPVMYIPTGKLLSILRLDAKTTV